MSARYPHIPQAERQTAVRISAGLWIGDLGFSRLLSPDPARPAFGTWLVRSFINPAWHGIETSARAGEDPTTKLFATAKAIMSIPPRHVDLIAVLNPGDVPGIRHTTFIHGMSSPFVPQPALPGTEVGFFPLDALPEAELDTRFQGWLGPVLQEAVIQGLGPMRVENMGAPYGDRT